MSNTLHEAIDAVRAGDTERAQLITADIIRDNPDDPNGWYLLSQLVESDARRAAYLSKTLALDPSHSRARIEFDALPPAVAGELMAAPTVEVAEPAAVEWETAGAMAAAAGTAPDLEAHVSPDAELIEHPEDLPEWLQPLAPEPVAVAAEPPPAVPVPVPAQPRPKPAAPPKKAAPAKKKGGNQALSILFGLLALLTIVVLAFLIYLLLF